MKAKEEAEKKAKEAKVASITLTQEQRDELKAQQEQFENLFKPSQGQQSVAGPSNS